MKTTMLATLGLLLLAWPLAAGDRMVVHEWGTFTVLQDHDGRELFGINVDDEPVPAFVHNLEPYILNTPVLSHDYWLMRQKGTPRFHPQVSMRLETPVIYFYPPANAQLPLKLDVEVKFRGGWLTEFYPDANVRLPGAEKGEFEFDNLTSKTVGELAWMNLLVGTQGTGPVTKEHVWLAPRKVAAATVTNDRQESEKYLFYRGVAQQKAPIRVATSSDGDQIKIRGNMHDILATKERAALDHLWLLEVRADGTSAYRRIAATTLTSDNEEVLLAAPRRFAEADFKKDRRAQLESEMHVSLVEDGLFADEATAMLSTWQRAYFTSPGLRVFYLVPRVWTDHVLPLTISGDPTIARSMIGRVELVSDQQRKSLEALAKVDDVNPRWLDQIDSKSSARIKLLAGRTDFGELGVKVPPHFQLYLNLGRFRNALVAAEEQKRGPGKSSLTRFINDYQLHSFRSERE